MDLFALPSHWQPGSASSGAEVSAQPGMKLSKTELLREVIQQLLTLLYARLQPQYPAESPKLFPGDGALCLPVQVMKDFLQVLIQASGQNNDLIIQPVVQSVVMGKCTYQPLGSASWPQWAALVIQGLHAWLMGFLASSVLDRCLSGEAYFF